jgi:deoxyhypusine synthase
MFVIESDATIVAPIVLSALLECTADPDAANAVIAESRAVQARSRAR